MRSSVFLFFLFVDFVDFADFLLCKKYRDYGENYCFFIFDLWLFSFSSNMLIAKLYTENSSHFH